LLLLLLLLLLTNVKGGSKDGIMKVSLTFSHSLMLSLW
jgi:hypothetical protein